MQHEFKFRPTNMQGARILDIPVVLTLGPISTTVGASADDWEVSAIKINNVDVALEHPLVEPILDFADKFSILDEAGKRWRRRNTHLQIA